jgi:hypothetical protein
MGPKKVTDFTLGTVIAKVTPYRDRGNRLIVNSDRIY